MTEFENVLETILEEYARRDTEGDFDTWEDTDSFVKEKAEVLLAYANLKKEPVSEDLEEAANNALNNVLNTHEIVNVGSCLEMFRFGAQWKEKEMRSTIELAEDHAMLAGMEKMKEQMMERAVEGTAHPDDKEIWCDLEKYHLSDGDKVKIIVIKEEE